MTSVSEKEKHSFSPLYTWQNSMENENSYFLNVDRNTLCRNYIMPFHMSLHSFAHQPPVCENIANTTTQKSNTSCFKIS